MPRRASDSALFVKFSTQSILNKAKSYGEKILDNDNKLHEEIIGAGHPVHDNVDYVLIQIPGDRDNIIERPVTACDKKLLEPGTKLFRDCHARKNLDDRPMLEECDVHRFFDEYEAFRSGKEEQATGTNLREWPGMDRASADDLAYFRVYTVEQLAELNDSKAAKFFALRQRARDYLDAAKKVGAVTNVRAELDARDRAAAEKDRQIAAMQEQIAQLVAGQKAAAAAAAEKGKEKR
jgi:hypothetical protein